MQSYTYSIYACVYIHTTYIHTCNHIYIYKTIYTCVYTYNLYTYVIYIYKHRYIHIRVYTRNIYTYIIISTYIHMHIPQLIYIYKNIYYYLTTIHVCT